MSQQEKNQFNKDGTMKRWALLQRIERLENIIKKQATLLSRIRFEERDRNFNVLREQSRGQPLLRQQPGWARGALGYF